MNNQHGPPQEAPLNQLLVDDKFTHSNNATSIPLVTDSFHTAVSYPKEITTTNADSNAYQQNSNYSSKEEVDSLYTHIEDRNPYPVSDYYQTETHDTRYSGQYDPRYDSSRGKSEGSWERPYPSGYDNPNESSGYGAGGDYSDGYRYDCSHSQDQYHWEEDRYQSKWQNPDYSDQQYSYSQDSYTQQNFPESYTRTDRYDTRFHQDRPYHSIGHRSGRGYNRDKYNEYHGYHGSHNQSYHPKHKDFRHGDCRNRDSQKEEELKPNVSFVQKRSAMLKRAQLEQGVKNKVSRGPQIVKPHRLSDSQSDTIKVEKTKQSEGSFPKRNLDKFKIPKKKNTSSAQPAKNSVSIPALDVQEKTKQVNLTTATLIPQTKATSSVNDSSVMTQPLEISNPKTPDSKTNESVKTTQVGISGSKIKRQQSANVNASGVNTSPTVLSTLDPKTLFSLAVTLQKSIKKVCIHLCVRLVENRALYYIYVFTSSS